MHRWLFAAAVILLVLAVAAIKNFDDLSDVRVTYATAPEAVASALRGTKIMFLSDLHVRRIGKREKEVLRVMSAVQPDYILISGDLMPYGGPIEPSLAFLKMLRPRRAGYAVLGDAEYKDGMRNCAYCHAPGSWAVRTDLPVKVLRDQVVTLEGPGGPAVDVWGADAKRKPDGFSWATEKKSGRPVIALEHYPDLFDRLAQAGADLVLSGDTHGGQAIGPRFVYEILLGRKEASYLSGRFADGKSTMWVSKGLGWSFAPLRLGVKPEVIIFDFKGSGVTKNSP